MVYGQTEVTRDLMDARRTAGLTTVYGAQDVAVHDFDGNRPRLTYTKDGAAQTLEADFIARAPLYVGDGFGQIFEANRHIISDPDRIYPGMVLRLVSDF